MPSATCQFCNEIQRAGRTPFHDIYGSILSSRIVADRQHLVAFPTLGQLVPGSLLVVPKQHIETFAQLSCELRIEALHFINQLEPRLQRFGHCFLFEHGAQSACGGGCGIYHGHVHLVPLPTPVRHDDVVDFQVQRAATLLEVWNKVEDCLEYLALRDGFGTVGYCVPDGSRPGFGSQYCRRRIAEYLNLGRPWDWRAYDSVEPFLLDTVEALRETYDGLPFHGVPY
jgi:diadenosine tetraphosphate (Ap4A) HIT family hydrolase